jgi:hypothetical protein
MKSWRVGAGATANAASVFGPVGFKVFGTSTASAFQTSAPETSAVTVVGSADATSDRWLSLDRFAPTLFHPIRSTPSCEVEVDESGPRQFRSDRIFGWHISTSRLGAMQA